MCGVSIIQVHKRSRLPHQLPGHHAAGEPEEAGGELHQRQQVLQQLRRHLPLPQTQEVLLSTLPSHYYHYHT